MVKSLRGTRVGTTTAPTCRFRPRAQCSAQRSSPRTSHRRAGPTCGPRYEALDDTTRTRVDGMSAYHSLYYSQGRAGYMPSKRNEQGGYAQYGFHDMEPSLRPLVRDPSRDAPAELVHRSSRVRHRRDGFRRVRTLPRRSERLGVPPRIYFHEWEVGDAVVWDNRRLMHRATPFDMTQPRRMWHTRIAGERESELALNHR